MSKANDSDQLTPAQQRQMRELREHQVPAAERGEMENPETDSKREVAEDAREVTEPQAQQPEEENKVTSVQHPEDLENPENLEDLNSLKTWMKKEFTSLVESNPSETDKQRLIDKTQAMAKYLAKRSGLKLSEGMTNEIVKDDSTPEITGEGEKDVLRGTISFMGEPILDYEYETDDQENNMRITQWHEGGIDTGLSSFKESLKDENFAKVDKDLEKKDQAET